MRSLLAVLGGFTGCYISFTHRSKFDRLIVFVKTFRNNLLCLFNSFVRTKLADKAFKSFPCDSIRRELFPFIHSFFTIHASSMTKKYIKSTLK